MKNYAKIADEFHSGLQSLSGELPITMGAFSELVKATTNDRGLSRKMKELIAFSIAVTARCDGCIAHHAQAVIKAKANRAEVCEAIGVAILMGGGPAVVYGVEALNAFDQLSANPPSSPK